MFNILKDEQTNLDFLAITLALIEDFFRQLHRIVFSVACRKIEGVQSLIGIDPVILTDSNLSALGSEEYLLNRIN